MLRKVLVYGTLKAGNPIRGLDQFKGATYLYDAATVDNRWKLIDVGPFPAAVPGSCNILGEVWEVTFDVFKQLDEIEGFPTYYNRSKVLLETGETVWMYHYPRPEEDIPDSKVYYVKEKNAYGWDSNYVDHQPEEHEVYYL